MYSSVCVQRYFAYIDKRVHPQADEVGCLIVFKARNIAGQFRNLSRKRQQNHVAQLWT